MRLLLFLLVYFIILVLSYSYLNHEKEKRLEGLTKNIQLNHEYQIRSAILPFKNSTDLIFNSIINKKEILFLQKLALEDKMQRDIYREQLLDKLNDFYKELHKFGIKQLHFHFPDATSFLRFHKPNKFGDNLKDIRYSLVLVNSNKERVNGFEEGRIFNGYRFVYPLYYEGEHIGSVETSMGFKAISRVSAQIYQTHQYMILDKNIVKDKVFSDERKNYELSYLGEDFYHEANKFVNYNKEVNATKIKSLNGSVVEYINKKLSTIVDTRKLKEYNVDTKYIKVYGDYYSINFLPIKNIKKENIGYIISYAKSEIYDNILNEYIDKLIITFLILTIIAIFIFYIEDSREKLRKLNIDANIQRDKALKATMAKSEFLANMSHEIRTPLNAIIGFVSILQRKSKEESTLKHLAIINKASKSLLNIIEDILDFSKIESGKIEIEELKFKLKEEFEAVYCLFEARSVEKKINFTIEFEDDLPEVVVTDLYRIKQVVSNLLSNAIKFTEEGKSIILRVEYNNGDLGVFVKDEGKGIAEDKLSHIFDSFSQEDSSTTRQYGGTGLGLSISNALIKLLNGELKVKSELGKGSEFYFFIPVKIVT